MIHTVRLVATVACTITCAVLVVKTFTNKLWGLPAYYGGQILIAWSMRHA